MTNLSQILAKNLKLFREGLGLTQEGLAERAGLSTFSVQSIENQRRWPVEKTLESISKALNISGARLFDDLKESYQVSPQEAIKALCHFHDLSEPKPLKKSSTSHQSYHYDLSRVPEDVLEALSRVPGKWELVRAVVGPLSEKTEELEQKNKKNA